MCGIVGMAGNLNSQHSKMFRDMLTFDYVRGVDSTGVAAVGLGTNHEPVVEKELGHPGNLWDWGTSGIFNDRGVSKTLKRVLIGHNRAATIGNVTGENAHPFTFGDITGVHNGSLRVWHELEGYADLDVDSKAIFNTIDKKGIDHCWESFYGAAALVYWNSEDGTLSIIRNGERPLWIAHSEKEDAIFWASELWMITVAASRSNIKLKMDSEKNKPVLWQPKENYLHVYKPTGMSCPLVEGRELEKKVVQTTQNTGSTTTAGWRGRHTSHRVYPKNNSAAPNNAWAQGYAKAGKEMVGTQFKFISLVIPMGVKTSANYSILCETKDGDKVRIFPATTSERSYWEGVRDLSEDGDVWFKMTARPRIEFLVKATKPEFQGYRISSDHVDELTAPEMSKHTSEISRLFNKNLEKVEPLEGEIIQLEDYNTIYKTWAGTATRRRWLELLAETDDKGCCKACNEKIDIEDHLSINWLTKRTVLCSVCAEQKDTVQLIKSMGV